jgi:hypothetical protein
MPEINAYQPDADGDPLLVYADVTGAQWPVTVSWGDGSTDQIPADDDEDIEHRYRQGGEFNVTATDAAGQTGTGTVSIPFANDRSGPAGPTALAAGDKGDPDAVVLGPGLLYVGDASAADPTDATTPPSATAYRPVGYTEEGSSFSYETTTEDITVAEENDPIRTVPTGTTSTLSFSMAEMTWENLLLALNAGSSAAATPPTMPTGPIEPVEPGSEQRVKLIWDSDYGSRWIFRQCIQSGTLTIDRKKAPDKGLLPVEFKCEKPATGAPFAVFPSTDGLV